MPAPSLAHTIGASSELSVSTPPSLAVTINPIFHNISSIITNSHESQSPETAHRASHFRPPRSPLTSAGANIYVLLSRAVSLSQNRCCSRASSVHVGDAAIDLTAQKFKPPLCRPTAPIASTQFSAPSALCFLQSFDPRPPPRRRLHPEPMLSTLHLLRRDPQSTAVVDLKYPGSLLSLFRKEKEGNKNRRD